MATRKTKTNTQAKNVAPSTPKIAAPASVKIAIPVPAKTKRTKRLLSSTLQSIPMAILVTGVPGTGKTTLGKKWCERSGWIHIDLNLLVEEHELYSGIDEEDMAKVARLPALQRAANERIEQAVAAGQNILLEGHLGCEIQLEVHRVLVLRLHPDELAKRLFARGYSPSKVQTNKMTELLDYCTVQAIKNYGQAKVFEMDVSGLQPEQTLKAFSQFMSFSKPGPGYKPHVDWSAQLFKEVDIYHSAERAGHVHNI